MTRVTVTNGPLTTIDTSTYSNEFHVNHYTFSQPEESIRYFKQLMQDVFQVSRCLFFLSACTFMNMEGLKLVFEYIQSQQNIFGLVLDTCSIKGDASIFTDQLCTFLASEHTKLNVFTIGNMHWVNVACIFQAIRKNRSIMLIDYCSPLDEQEVPELMDLIRFGTLETIFIHSLPPSWFVRIGSAIRQSTTLKHLMLMDGGVNKYSRSMIDAFCLQVGPHRTFQGLIDDVSSYIKLTLQIFREVNLLVTLLSARVIKRVGSQSVLRLIPVDIVRKLATFIYHPTVAVSF